jgi:hypothetical protein
MRLFDPQIWFCRDRELTGFANDNETVINCNGCYLFQNKELGLTSVCRDVELNDCVVNENVRDCALFESLSQSENQPDATVVVVH